MVLDEYNKLRLMCVCLCVYYATANRNPKKVFTWQDICITLDDRRIFEKGMYMSKKDLKNNLMIIQNPRYQSGLYRIYAEHVKKKINSK